MSHEIDVFVPGIVEESEFPRVCSAVGSAFPPDNQPVVSCAHHDRMLEEDGRSRILVIVPDIETDAVDIKDGIRQNLLGYFGDGAPIAVYGAGELA